MSKIHNKHNVQNVSYHIIWIPKYRKHILKGNIEEYLRECLIDKARRMKINIEAFEIMPDHIHIFVKANTQLTISYIVQQLKGYTSYMLRKKFPFLKRYITLWTHSYYVETIGCISEKSVKKYIELQKSK